MKEKDRDNPGIEEIINEKDSNLQKEKYNEYVKNMTPKNNGVLKLCKGVYNRGKYLPFRGDIL